MLSLNLKSGEYLTIGDNIAVQIFEQSGSSFRVSIKAPREIPILRGEVHERTAKRPEGLHRQGHKSLSEQKYNAKHYEKWMEKREQRENQRKQEAEEKTAVLQELMELAGHMDELAAAHGMQDQLEHLRGRLQQLLREDQKET